MVESLTLSKLIKLYGERENHDWIRLVLIALAFTPSVAFSEDTFVGSWFACYVEFGNSPRGSSVLQIDKKDSIYSVLIQDGSPKSYFGSGKLVRGQLLVRGCNYYRDEAVDGCDVKKPPLNFRLKKSDLKRKYKNLNLSLKKSEWILMKTEQSLDTLMARCNQLADEKNLDKDGWPKKF